MRIVIDVGNTNVTFGLVRGTGISCVFVLNQRKVKDGLFFKKCLSAYAKKHRFRRKDICEIVICSVVPRLDKLLVSRLEKVFPGATIFRLGKEIPIPIKNKYRLPSQVGKDRLANAVGARFCYRLPAIIVDFGTAITIDIVSAKSEYLGGVIVPGIKLSLSALHKNTALLPLITSGIPENIIGKDTRNSMLSGIFYGYAFLVDGFIEVFRKKLKGRCIVIATGGNLKLMKSLCKGIDLYDACITLKGIEKAYIIAKNKGMRV